MLGKLADVLTDPKKRDLACAAGGMGLLLAGGKLSALALFAKGFAGLERHWRAAHPEFEGDFAARWRRATGFYEATHQDPVNRALHVAGIPLIVAGAAGLLAWPRYTPPWAASWAAFAGGWTLNFIGHGVFERNAPAFADDPLSFVAGPAWDLTQLGRLLGGAPGAEAEPAAAPTASPAPVAAPPQAALTSA